MDRRRCQERTHNTELSHFAPIMKSYTACHSTPKLTQRRIISRCMQPVNEYEHCSLVLFAFQHSVVHCSVCKATPDLVREHAVPVSAATPRSIVVRPTGRPFRAYTSGC